LKNTNLEFWDTIITPHRGWFEFRLKELWQFKDLLWIIIKRDVVTQYKQTLLGPLWLFIQPILTTVVFTVIFGNIAKLSTDGLPKPLFYLAGIVAWNYFSTCLTSTSISLSGNAALFGKVYFPRMIMPLGTVISSLVRFFIQVLLLILMIIYYSNFTGTLNLNVHFTHVLLFPILILIMGIQGLGYGLILSACTVKYRDLRYLISFGVRLLMYASPVIFPISIVPEKYLPYILANPMTAVIETFRFISLGQGNYNFNTLGYSIFMTFVIFFIGLLLFNRVEKNFIDSV